MQASIMFSVTVCHNTL